MVDYRIRFKRRLDPKIHKNIFSARSAAYRSCVKRGWGSKCTIYHMIGYTKYEFGTVTSRGDVVIWRFIGQQDPYLLNEKGEIRPYKYIL